MSEPARPGPLSGLLVADFSRVLAGPYCTMLLADLGADVIKVESPGGDDTRSWMPPVTKDGVSTYFLAINRNKRSVALDLKDDGDRALAQELARRADVFVQNFKPGGLARFGLDYDTVSATNPAVIYASISGFGSGGGNLPGYDLMVQAMSGLLSLTGDPEGPPYRAGISNRNKRSVALDLKDDGDRALAQELARRADVFVQNFKPGGLARFGLDYDTVSATNPAVIYASISGFGSGGGNLPGYDLMVQAMSGLLSLTGDPEGPPYRAGISAFDVMAGLHTTIAILAARSRSSPR